MSYYERHIFFCLNRRENGEASCAEHDADSAFAHCKSRVKAEKLNGPGKIRVKTTKRDIEAVGMDGPIVAYDLHASGAVETLKNPTILLMVSGDLHISEIERIFRSNLGFAGDARIRAEVRIPPAGGLRIAGHLSAPKVDAKGFLIEDLEATVSARPEALVAEISKARYAGGTATGLFRIQDLAGGGKARPMTLALEARNLQLERFFGDIRLPGTGLSGGAALSLALRWGEGGLERLFEFVHVSLITIGINERIRISRAPRLQLRVLLRETIKRGVRTEENLCGQ